MSNEQRASQAVVLGARTYYEEFSERMRGAGQDSWPEWDELNSSQLEAWMLAYASAVEMGTRLGVAVRRMAA